MSGSGISWAVCKSAPRSRQITMPAPHHSSFLYRPDALPATQPTASKHWRQKHWSLMFETLVSVKDKLTHCSQKVCCQERLFNCYSLFCICYILNTNVSVIEFLSSFLCCVPLQVLICACLFISGKLVVCRFYPRERKCNANYTK